MVVGRELNENEVDLVWTIDRSEVIENLYYHENGVLVLKPKHFELSGWSPQGIQQYTPILSDCVRRGGWFYGFFDDGRLVAVVLLESKLIGLEKDQLQLKFLHVSRTYRGQGLGRQLFELAKQKAREKGAKRLYISATPSEQTIHFYQSLGCTVTNELDPNLFALEPEDIHLECWL
jgi:predicted N-acetyltransferase YhbS